MTTPTTEPVITPDLEGKNVTAVVREPIQHGTMKVKSFSGTCGAIGEVFLAIHDVTKLVGRNGEVLTEEPGIVGMLGRSSLVPVKNIAVIYAVEEGASVVEAIFPR